MNDETLLLTLGEGPGSQDEVIMAYKWDKAKREADELVSAAMMKIPRLWNWMGIKAEERRRRRIAEDITHMFCKHLSNLALNKHEASLCAHYCRIRILIHEKRYQNDSDR